MVDLKVTVSDFFRSLPIYSAIHDDGVKAITESLENPVVVQKGSLIKEMAIPNKDFYFLIDGYLKEMYKNIYTGEDELFNLVPPGTVFVNEDTLYFNRRPSHFYTAYSQVIYAKLTYTTYQKLLEEYPEIRMLHISASAEIQKNRRARLTMLRMSSTPDRVKWVQTVRPDLYKVMDRVTLSQYIGVSRASLYRAFDKNNKSQY